MKTYYFKNTATHASTLGVYNYDMDTTTSGAVSIYGEAGNSPQTTWTYSATTEPNLTTWPNGTYTWYLVVTTANSSLNLTGVTLRRTSSTWTDKATKSASMTTLMSPTGTYSGTITWNDGTQNPGGSAQNDRFVVTFTFTRVAGAMSTQTATFSAGGSTHSRIDTPLDAAPSPIDMTPNLQTIRNKFINKI